MSERVKSHRDLERKKQVKRRHINAVEELKEKKHKRNKFHQEQREKIANDIHLSNYLKSLSIDLHFSGANRRRFMQGAREMYGVLSSQDGDLAPITPDTKAAAFKRKGVEEMLDPANYIDENAALMGWVAKQEGHRIAGLNSRGAGRMAVYSLERCNISNPTIELQREVAHSIAKPH